MSRTIFFVVGGCGAAALAAALFVFVSTPQESIQGAITPTQIITIDDIAVHVAVADAAQERQQGLSGVSGLKSDEGMLFVFENEGLYSFWMKDMLFSIDMLWISHGGRVVHIEPSVSPNTYPQTFTSATPARYVLEVPAGFALKNDITVGSRAVF